MNPNSLNEQSMLQAGAERYARAQAKSVEHGQLTSAASKVFTNAVGLVAAAMQEALNEAYGPGRKPAWFQAVSELGALACAVIALRLAFTAVGERTAIQVVTEGIGRQVELDLIAEAVRRGTITTDMDEKQRAAARKAGEKLYEKLVKGASKWREMDKRVEVFTDRAREAGFWSPQGADEHVKVGAALFGFVQQHTDIFVVVYEGEGEIDEQGMPAKVTFCGVELSETASKRMESIEEMEAWMHPVYKPMLTKPRAWESAFTGCYEEPKLAATVQVIRSINKTHMKQVNDAVKTGAPFAQALNTIQAVPMQASLTVAHYMSWASKSHKLMDWMEEEEITLKGFPQPVLIIEAEDDEKVVKDKKEFNKVQRALRKELKTTLTLANEYVSYGRFYLPSALDWRSRVYAKPHLNHQREDAAKALFQFDEGQVLTLDGAAWLAIHLCNSGAFKMPNGKKADKLPLDQRVKWVHDHEDRIIKMMVDPTKDWWWVEADSPFMFLAACEAWTEYRKNPEGYLCRLPVGIDGSCSGLQHFSALLRDRVGGTHVNLVAQDEPADVYQVVADVVSPQVTEDAETNVYARRWLAIGISRKVAKRCVMTYVYGSKQFGFAEHLAEDFFKELTKVVMPDMQPELNEKPWEFSFRCERELKATAHYLAKHIWNAVQVTVKAAADAMVWLQDLAGLLASKGIPLNWTTPSGFPVINAYYAPQVERVDMTLWDRAVSVPRRMKPTVMVGQNTKELLPRKCRSSVSPNAIHSLDAAHLHLAVLRAREEGITSVMLIHDSFSCLPNDMKRFSEIVRETFVEMYLNNDPLQNIYDNALAALTGDDETLSKLKPPPAKGDLDLQEVLNSHYAFA